MDETLPQKPINPYGESKLIFEQILKWYDAIHGLQVRGAAVFQRRRGDGEIRRGSPRSRSHLIPNILKVALGQKEHAEIYGTDYETPDGTCIRDYIHIVDLAQAHILALDVEQSAFYNLGTGGGNSVAEVIECCRRVTGHAIPVVEKSRRPGDPPRLIAASGKIQKQLGWQPRYQSLDDIVGSAWAWHTRHPQGYGD